MAEMNYCQGEPGTGSEKQLVELWREHRVFKQLIQELFPGTGHKSKTNLLADHYAIPPFRFVPIITRDTGLVCALDILFLRRDNLGILRRDNPGNLVMNNGDIDKRIKVLSDALRRPTSAGEIEGFSPEGRRESGLLPA